MFSRCHSSLWNICPGSTIKEGAKQGVIFISFLINFITSPKKKEVFMQSADYSWKPSVGIA